jgi:hypothetical protein
MEGYGSAALTKDLVVPKTYGSNGSGTLLEFYKRSSFQNRVIDEKKHSFGCIELLILMT